MFCLRAPWYLQYFCRETIICEKKNQYPEITEELASLMFSWLALSENQKCLWTMWKNRKLDWWVLISLVIPMSLVLKDCSSVRFKWVGKQQEMLTQLLGILWHTCVNLAWNWKETKLNSMQLNVVLVVCCYRLPVYQVRKNLKIARALGSLGIFCSIPLESEGRLYVEHALLFSF